MSFNRYLRLALLIACATPGVAVAATDGDWYSRLRFEHLTVTEGMPSNRVQSILRDSAGFIWFGTHQGLARYDGNALAIYKSQPDDPRALPAPLISLLFEDREKRMWVGFAWGLHGVALYQRECDCFKRYGEGENSHDVRAMIEDHTGRLWVGTEDGLGLLDPETGAWTLHSLRAQEASAPDPVVNTVLEDHAGRLWLGTNRGLLRFDPEKDRYERWPGSPEDGLSLSGAAVWDLLENPDGTIWVATLGMGLLRIAPDSHRMTAQYMPDAADPGSIRSTHVRRLLRDRAGRLYVGSENGGLDVLDTNNRFIHYTPDLDDKASLNSWSIWALHLDDQGTLWVGTHNGGVNWTTTDGQRFHPVEAMREGLNDPHVTAVFKDRRDHVWIGTDGGGLDELDRSTGRFTHYRHRPGDPESLGSNAVLSILEDSHGDLWIGGWGGGLGRLDRATGKVTQFRHDPADPQSLSTDDIWTVRELRTGELLVGTQSGAELFDRATHRVRHIAALYASAGDGATQSAAEDAAGGLWLCGSRFMGNSTLVHIDRKTKTVATYTAQAGDPDGLTPGWCLSVYPDSQGNVWVGTQEGLSVLPWRGQRFERWRLPESVAGEEVTNVLEDDLGNVWATTGQNVVRLVDGVHLPPSGVIDIFDRHDGFRGPTPPGAASRAPDGEMFVGGASGLTGFRPANVGRNPAIPRVVLTDVKVLNRSLRPCAKDSPLVSAASVATGLTLNYRESIITFVFAALNLRLPEKNRYAYKLDGFEGDWSYVGSKHEATYMNLAPGDYTFRVKAANNDGVWNEDGLAFHLRVLPPFWGTWWFRLLAAASTGLFVFAWAARVYQRRVTALSARARELAARMEERTRLARELHDTLEQALAGIRLQLAVAVKNVRESPEKTEKNLELARRMLAYCIEDARRTVMDMRSQSLEHTSLAQALGEEGRRLTAETPIQVDVVVVGAYRRLDIMTEHHLLRIAQEALTNAIKHSSGDRVQIELTYGESATVLVIRDNGGGLAPVSEPGRLHFGLQGMRERAERIGGTLAIGEASTGGVEITVNVPRSPKKETSV